MTLVRISNRLGVKQKNLFFFFESLHWPKFLRQKINTNISYQFAIMTLIRTSDRLGVNRKMSFYHFWKPSFKKKHISPLDGATYQKYYSPILSSYLNLWGVCVMTFLDISNRLAVKHKKHISPLDGATYQKYYRPILSSYPNLWGVCVMTLIRISIRLAVLSKWAQLIPPLLPGVAYAFHEFGYVVGELINENCLNY